MRYQAMHLKRKEVQNMKVLFKKKGTCENLIIIPEGTHYSITVECKNEDKQLVFNVGGERFVLESTKDICQKSRGANAELAENIFKEIVYYVKQFPTSLGILDIASIQDQVLNRYEALLEPQKEESMPEQTQTQYMKAPFIFSKILGYLEEKQGSTVGEWFREADVKLNEDGNLVISVQSAFCREVIKRRCSSLMKEGLIEMGLDNMDIIFVGNEEYEDV